MFGRSKFDFFSAGIVFGTLIFLSASASIVVFVSPENANRWEIAIFYSGLILGFGGLFYLGAFYSKKLFFKEKEPGRYVVSSLRQGMLLSLGSVSLLGMFRLQILSLSTACLVFGALIFFELFFRTK